jgi:hypothetical protein
MINHLADLLTVFPGSENRTRCFAHILNLVAKCIMRQFDAPKSKKKGKTAFEVLVDDELDRDGSDSDSDHSEDINDELSDDNDVEMAEAESAEDVEGDGDADEGRANMMEEEIKALEEAVKPVKLVLVKVGC